MKIIETKTDNDHFFELFENGDVRVSYYNMVKKYKKIKKEKVNERTLLKFIHNYNELNFADFLKIYREV